MIPIVSFIGKSNSGKTTLLEKVVIEIKLKGFRVAVIKHSHHDFNIDQSGKDSWRFAQAGSDVVVISSSKKLAFIEYLDKELTLAEIELLIRGKADVVMAEGYKNHNIAKILVQGAEQAQEQLDHDEKILAVVSPHLSSRRVVQFDNDVITNITNLVIERISGSTPLGCESGSGVVDVTVERDTNPIDVFEVLLAKSTALHGHVCPGQVIGVRMAIRGCQELGITTGNGENERLVVYVEIDRCATDAIQVVTGCKLGKRTMKYVDYGKLAATFVDLQTGNAVRLTARANARVKAALCGGAQELTKYEDQVAAYRVMSDEELFQMKRVVMRIPAEDMPGPPLRRVTCDQCGEEINDCREVRLMGKVLCRACGYGSYYQNGDTEPRTAADV